MLHYASTIHGNGYTSNCSIFKNHRKINVYGNRIMNHKNCNKYFKKCLTYISFSYYSIILFYIILVHHLIGLMIISSEKTIYFFLNGQIFVMQKWKLIYMFQNDQGFLKQMFVNDN